jgi:murein L,D-transpeptidase YcbB/YkuD
MKIHFPVIVGKSQHQTPVFSDRVMYIDFNPYWNIPPSIARNEELPRLRKDRLHLVKRHIRLFSSWRADAVELDPTTMDWNTISRSQISGFKLRQDPGPWNALGRVKFVFPNKYDVYMHDTPTQNLFSRNKRDFSHGCIRVSDPPSLALFILSRETSGWNREKIDAIFKSGKRKIVRPDVLVPVHITYQTAWVDKNGLICFNRDIYRRDRKLGQALFPEDVLN